MVVFIEFLPESRLLQMVISRGHRLNMFFCRRL